MKHPTWKRYRSPSRLKTPIERLLWALSRPPPGAEVEDAPRTDRLRWWPGRPPSAFVVCSGLAHVSSLPCMILASLGRPQRHRGREVGQRPARTVCSWCVPKGLMVGTAEDAVLEGPRTKRIRMRGRPPTNDGCLSLVLFIFFSFPFCSPPFRSRPLPARNIFDWMLQTTPTQSSTRTLSGSPKKTARALSDRPAAARPPHRGHQGAGTVVAIATGAVSSVRPRRDGGHPLLELFGDPSVEVRLRHVALADI